MKESPVIVEVQPSHIPATRLNSGWLAALIFVHVSRGHCHMAVDGMLQPSLIQRKYVEQTQHVSPLNKNKYQTTLLQTLCKTETTTVPGNKVMHMYIPSYPWRNPTSWLTSGCRVGCSMGQYVCMSGLILVLPRGCCKQFV